jgi:hypothetical protein
MVRPDFSRRSDAAELMDSECRDFADYSACLADLAQVNRVTLTHRPTLGFLDGLFRSGRLGGGRRITLVDAGAGHGDLLRTIDRWAEARGLALDLVGVDANPWAARAAEAATVPGRPIRYVTADFFAADLGPVDLIVSSQVTHHLDDATLSGFLAWMEATARIAWCVGDLYRHPIPYHVFRLWSWAAGWHRFVRHDGPVSIARSLTLAEWRQRIVEAGLDPQSMALRWHMPFRVSLTRIRPA